mmetsp:Transcript_14181/g.20033  ORF Transcript_14181/g.20033 Transcript_14181/m.20033 type:complete len:217 (-) Transcript_14181:69-719(-)
MRLINFKTKLVLLHLIHVSSEAVARASNITVRLAKLSDISSIRNINLRTLPENYTKEFYESQLMQWPMLSLVAEYKAAGKEDRPEVIGYILGAIQGLDALFHGGKRGPEFTAGGHLTSLAVVPERRRMGAAIRLVSEFHGQLKREHRVNRCSLHVRKSNHKAVNLYKSVFGYTTAEVVREYYQDKEDAFLMTVNLEEAERGYYEYCMHEFSSKTEL